MGDYAQVLGVGTWSIPYSQTAYRPRAVSVVMKHSWGASCAGIDWRGYDVGIGSYELEIAYPLTRAQLDLSPKER